MGVWSHILEALPMSKCMHVCQDDHTHKDILGHSRMPQDA